MPLWFAYTYFIWYNLLMKFYYTRRLLYLPLIALVLFYSTSLFCEGELSPQEAIRKYRIITQTATDPKEVANAHYEIGAALEKLGQNNEATAEYLKIIINYPELSEVTRKAENNLANLYSGFREKAVELKGEYEAGNEQKDPHMFFAYIKSLYENHRNLAQYKRALYVLEKLYDMDPENPSYLVDMGEIYLHGYNDTDRAIFHFREAVRLNPRDAKAYAELGRAYEKKGDYESAITVYRKAADISPANPWAIYGLRRIEGIVLASDKRLIKDWYFLGPFDNTAKDALNKNFPPEGTIDLAGEYTGKGGILIKWSRPFSYDVSGDVDLNLLFKPNDYAVAYALTYAHSPKDKKVQLRFGAEDGIKIWLNDKVVVKSEIAKAGEVDSDIVEVNLKKGWNKILLKVTDTWGSWGFYFRVTDLNGKPVEDIIFDPLKDQDRVKYVYGKFVRERRSKFTKMAALYTLAVSSFLLGLYFMISNILSKRKINRMKEDFVSSVSHELKTPIAAVRMLAETLKRGKVKGAGREDQYYGMIIRESDRLTRFINKILDFAKLEKGGKVFYFEEDDICALAKTAIDIYGDEAQDKDLKLSLDLEKEDLKAEVDKDAILQVMLNLVDNAYKYSKDEKDITIGVKDSGQNITIEISDKGIGIPKDSIEKVFDKFYRVDRYFTKHVKGSGLGLSFVKDVINSHSGKIAVQSEPGKGTKFIISLPKKRA